jgi:peptidoglycan/LPS O-acetylase OafA/YrhL
MGKSNNKLLGLEGFRFGAAITILIWHYQHFSFVGTESSFFVKHEQPFYGPLYLLYNYGWVGVQVFWVISGFIFAWNYSERIRDRQVGPKEFFIARFSRLYPLHFLTLCVVALLQIIYSTVSSGRPFVYSNNSCLDFIQHLFFASSWGIENPIGFNGPVWSVSVEVLVYLLFFLNLRYLPFGKTTTSLILAAATALALIFPDYVLFESVVYFYSGFLVHQFLARRNDKKRKASRLLLPWAGLCVVILSTIFLRLSDMQIARELTTNKYSVHILLLSSVCFVIAIVAPWNPKSRELASWLEKLGDITYSIYLLHFPIQLLIAYAFLANGQSTPWRSGWLLVAYVFVVLALSCVVFKSFELPAKTHIRRFFSGR